ncbi:MAG: T9SS type A sorting domain-containing protein [Lewinellaceae bacterium]|nr:T9SS type A sorting domain-containing protein [Saprospiraceae bacterium]MCB9337491.1 T9SS type A sorting domain-containing protein [Lewinellaceae bacterium]
MKNLLHLFTACPAMAGKNAIAACLVAGILILGNANLLATTYTFNGSTNSDWATASNWSTGTVPTSLASGDAVVIAANCSMNDVSITFPSGTSLTVNNGIALSPSLNTYITIASGATLTVQASGSIGSGRLTNSGTFDLYGSYTIYYYTNSSGGILNVKSGGTYTNHDGAQTFASGGTVNNDGTMNFGGGSNAGILNNNSGGNITHSDGNGAQLSNSGTINNAGSFLSRTSSTTGMFNNSGTLTSAISAHFTVSNGGTLTNTGMISVPAGAAFNVNSGGTLTNQNTFKGAGTLTQSGTFTNSASAEIEPGASPGKLTVTGDLNLGSATYNCEINGTVQGTSYDWLAVSGAATLTNATLTVTWGFTPSAGQTFSVLTCGSRTGEFATVNIPPVSGLVFTVTHSAGGVTISASSAPVTYTFTGSGNWSSSGNWDANSVPPATLLAGDAIVINGSGTCTMDGNQTINSGATLTVNASKTLTISGAFTLTNHGTMTVNGTLSKSSGSSVLTNSATGGITVASGGALNNDSGSFSNAGTFTTNSGGTFGNGSGTFTNSGTYNNGGSNYSTYGGFSNSGTITNTGTMTGSQYINIQNSGSWTNSAGGSMTMNGFYNSGTNASLTNNGTMSIGLSNSKTFVNNATFTVNYLGQANNSGATWTNSSGATFTVGAVPFSNAGTFHNDGTMTLNQNGNTGSTFANNGTFNCAGTLTLNSGSATNAATKSISLSGTLNLNSAFAFTNSGTINGGGTLNVAGGSLTNNGTISNLGLIGFTGNGTLTVASGSTFSTSNGSNTNITSGTLTVNSGATATMGGQLDIFSGGTLNVNGAMTVSGFAFNNAGIIKGTGTITPTTALNNSGFIRPGASPGTLSISGDLNLGSGTYTCEVDGTSAGQFDVLAVSGTATIGASSKLHLIFSVPIVNGTTFDVLTAGTVSGSFAGGNITYANTGTGNVNGVSLTYPGGNMVRVTATSLLPVELVRFTGKEVDGKALLEWETASELNNEGFNVERSRDGRLWENIGFVAGNGTTTTAQYYSFLDEKPLSPHVGGCEGGCVNYYRLKQTDFDGNFEYSPVVSADLTNLQDLSNLRFFPNPATDAVTLALRTDFSGKAILTLHDLTGRVVKTQQLWLEENTPAPDIRLVGLTAGLYLAKVQAGMQHWQARLLVK